MVKLVAERSVKYRQKGDDGRWYEYAGEYGVDLPATLTNTKGHGWYVKRGGNFFDLISGDNVSVNTSTIPSTAVSTDVWSLRPGPHCFRGAVVADTFISGVTHINTNGNYTINPTAEPSNNFFINYRYAPTIILPDPNEFEGMEMTFLRYIYFPSRPRTRPEINDVKLSGGDYSNLWIAESDEEYGSLIDRVHEYTLQNNIITKVKAMGGYWFVYQV